MVCSNGFDSIIIIKWNLFKNGWTFLSYWRMFLSIFERWHFLIDECRSFIGINILFFSFFFFITVLLVHFLPLNAHSKLVFKGKSADQSKNSICSGEHNDVCVPFVWAGCAFYPVPTAPFTRNRVRALGWYEISYYGSNWIHQESCPSEYREFVYREILVMIRFTHETNRRLKEIP